MTSPDPTEELIARMLRSRAEGEVPSSLLDDVQRRVGVGSREPGTASRPARSWPGRPGRLAIGAATVLACLVLLAGVLAVGGVVRFGPAAAHGPTAAPTGASSPVGSASTGLAPVASPGSQGSAPGPSRSPAQSAYSLPDGWRLQVARQGDSASTLHLFDASGAEASGWPVALPGACAPGVAIGPAGAAFAACDRDGQAVVVGLTRVGTPLAGWPVSVAGSVGAPEWWDFRGSTSLPPIVVGPGGTVYLAVASDAGGLAVHAFSTSGSAVRGWPRTLPGPWPGFLVAPDGTVVGWWFEGASGGETGPPTAQRTVYTMIGPDGQTLDGWPQGSKSMASGPVAASDGGIFYTAVSATVFHRSRTGEWTEVYRLPYPIAPDLRPDGALLFVGDADVYVVTQGGLPAPGWPYRSGTSLLGPDCDGAGPAQPRSLFAVGPDSSLFLVRPGPQGDAVAALDRHGQQLGGWPYTVPDGWRALGLDPATDGGLAVSLAEDPCGGAASRATVRLSASAAVLGDPPETPLSRVYEALRIQGLRLEDGASLAGSAGSVHVRFTLVNASSAAVRLPLVALDGAVSYAAGTVQTWLERLGPDPAISCLSGAARKGAWYATSGWRQTSTEPVSLDPGEAMPPRFETILGPSVTDCLPPGDYRFHVEYKRLDGGLDDVVDEAAADFAVVGPSDRPPTSP